MAKNVSTAGRAVSGIPCSNLTMSLILEQAMVSFTNQALKGVPRTHQVDLLEKYQSVTKEDVLAALRTHFLPLFDPSQSIAVVVTAPSKAQEISQELTSEGFNVSKRELADDPSELEEGSEDSGSHSGSESESDSRSP